MLNEALARPVTEKTLNLPTDKPITVRACLIGDRLHLRGLYEPPLALGPLVLPAGENGLIMLFRYGAVVMFNLSAGEQERYLQELKPRVQEPLAKLESEDTSIFISPPEVDSIITTNGIGLYDFSLSRLKVVAIVLARSVALARYEAAMTSAFDLIEPLALHIEQETRGWRIKELLRHIGGVLLTQHKMVGRVEIQDKPELIWDQPELERLYVRLEAEYELRERNSILERKLAIISRTAETTINLLHNRRILRVEWYIVILIVIEVLLYSYEMWRH
jgi:uncharacterized Rmd1/YagE family protein